MLIAANSTRQADTNRSLVPYVKSRTPYMCPSIKVQLARRCATASKMRFPEARLSSAWRRPWLSRGLWLATDACRMYDKVFCAHEGKRDGKYEFVRSRSIGSVLLPTIMKSTVIDEIVPRLWRAVESGHSRFRARDSTPRSDARARVQPRYERDERKKPIQVDAH